MKTNSYYGILNLSSRSAIDDRSPLFFFFFLIKNRILKTMHFSEIDTPEADASDGGEERTNCQLLIKEDQTITNTEGRSMKRHFDFF